MLTIRDEQMTVFRSHARQAFEARLVRHIARCYLAEYAELTRAGGGVRQFIQASIARAARYGIHTERALAGWIDLAACYGLEFDSRDEMAWTREILDDDSLAGPTKIELLFELLPED